MTLSPIETIKETLLKANNEWTLFDNYIAKMTKSGIQVHSGLIDLNKFMLTDTYWPAICRPTVYGESIWSVEIHDNDGYAGDDVDEFSWNKFLDVEQKAFFKKAVKSGKKSDLVKAQGQFIESLGRPKFEPIEHLKTVARSIGITENLDKLFFGSDAKWDRVAYLKDADAKEFITAKVAQNQFNTDNPKWHEHKDQIEDRFCFFV